MTSFDLTWAPWEYVFDFRYEGKVNSSNEGKWISSNECFGWPKNTEACSRHDKKTWKCHPLFIPHGLYEKSPQESK